MADIEMMMRALRNADAAGDAEGARRIAGMIREAQAGAGTAPAEPVTTGEDIARSAGAGAIRGAAGTADLAGEFWKLLSNTPEQLARMTGLYGPSQKPETPPAETFREMAGRLTGGFSEYQPQTLPGEYARTVGEFAGGAATLPIGGPFRAMGQSVIPALASEAAGQATEGTPYETVARIGAALTAPVGLELLKAGTRRALTGPEVRMTRPGSERAASVSTLEQAGVPMTAGQRMGSERLMRLEGVEATDLQTMEGVTKAAMKIMGSDAARATPKALAERKNTLGAVFDRAERVVNEVPTSADVQAIDDVVRQFYDIRGNEKMSAAIREAAEKVRDAAKANKPVSGASIADFRTRLREVIQANAGDANAMAAMGMSSALDNMLERGASRVDPDLYNALRDARSKYRDYLTILRAVNRSGSDARSGMITPNALGTAARMREGTKYITGEGRTQLGDLAFAAEEVVAALPTVAAGGQRYVAGALPALGAVGAGAAGGDIMSGLLGLGAGIALPAAGRAAIRSGPAQRGLMPPEQLMLERLTRRTAPLSGGLLGTQD